jgi:group I intron endonuclease
MILNIQIRYGVIYRAIFPNNKSYIGYAINIEKRKKEHKRHSFNKNSKEYNYAFHRAIRKYGWFNINWHILENKVISNNLPEIERFYISEFNTYNYGYNETKGGDGWLGKSHTKEAREKISRSKKGKSYHTPESRAKISAFMKNRICTKEHKRKVAFSKMGNKNPMNNPEYRKRVSEAKKGSITSEETKAKISKSCIDKNINAKKYKIITPNGNEQIIFNLSKYCRKNNLNTSHMSAVANGKRNHHNGYKVEKYE